LNIMIFGHASCASACNGEALRQCHAATAHIPKILALAPAYMPL
jgi:hypothetical protein